MPSLREYIIRAVSPSMEMPQKEAIPRTMKRAAPARRKAEQEICVSLSGLVEGRAHNEAAGPSRGALRASPILSGGGSILRAFTSHADCRN